MCAGWGPPRDSDGKPSYPSREKLSIEVSFLIMTRMDGLVTRMESYPATSRETRWRDSDVLGQVAMSERNAGMRASAPRPGPARAVLGFPLVLTRPVMI